MTRPDRPPHDPLQADEADLARVLRALPAGEPSPEVDAAILAAATNALSPGQAARRPRRRWLPTWALGTAAAAVLAIGISQQLRPPLATEQAAAPATPPAASAPARAERLDVELREKAPLPDNAPPPPPPPSPAPPRRSAVAPPPPAPAAAASEAMAEAPAPAPAAPSDQAGFAPPPLQDGPSADRLEDIVVAGARRQAEAEAAANAKAADAAAERHAREAQGLPSRQAAALPPVSADSRLGRDAWLERIRERLRQGDRASARASLLEFTRVHTDTAVPADLVPLLR